MGRGIKPLINANRLGLWNWEEEKEHGRGGGAKWEREPM
jgi:hypothetical protein